MVVSGSDTTSTGSCTPRLTNTRKWQLGGGVEIGKQRREEEEKRTEENRRGEEEKRRRGEEGGGPLYPALFFYPYWLIYKYY